MILLLCKTDNYSERAQAFARSAFGERLVIHTGRTGDPLPEGVADHRWEWVISFLSPWIVPRHLLENADAAINFHPGNSNYPGTGCYNFALYEETPTYGCICHHMLEKVDTGAIIEERCFSTENIASVEQLKQRTMQEMGTLFENIVSIIARGDALPVAPMAWSRRPFTRRQLEELRRVTPDMSADEIRRRVRAVTYPGFPGAEIELGGVSFFSEVPDREPIA